MVRHRFLTAVAATALLGGVLAATPAAASVTEIERGGNTVVHESQRQRGEPGTRGSGGRQQYLNRECRRAGVLISCDITNAQGTYSWNNGFQCYVINVEVLPGDPMNSQRGEPGGAFYGCFTEAQARAGSRTSNRVWWSDVEWPTGGMNGRSWIDTVVTSMTFTAIDAGIVPEPGPDRAGVLGLPTWMWVNNPTPPTAGVVTAADTQGDMTLTTRATWLGVTWNMGDGTSHECQHGTPYADSYGVSPSPTCGHLYTKPGNYTVTATSRWRVDWQLGFESGSREYTRVATVPIRIAEVQVLNR